MLTYPIEVSRLDIFSQFLTPSGVSLKNHKTVENIEIMMQLVHANRGITALPLWLAKEFQDKLAINTIKIGEQGIHKNIYMGLRADEQKPRYIEDLIRLAKTVY